ncbi:MAG: GTP cyclohydrolase [Desulfovibrionaceae bacterium]|nr:GTP cyclohydrolase [Desulfovibrionaceae bacterium]
MNEDARLTRPKSSPTEAPALSPRKEKATGWKVPLLFCAVLLALIGLAAVLRGGPAPLPPVPTPLLEQAQGMDIRLTGAEGTQWQSRITSEASGFAPRAEKDAKLYALVGEALAAGRQDAACTASVLVGDVALRDAALGQIFEHAVADCGRLVWGVFAIRGASPEAAASWAAALDARWRACNKGQNN